MEPMRIQMFAMTIGVRGRVIAARRSFFRRERGCGWGASADGDAGG